LTFNQLVAGSNPARPTIIHDANLQEANLNMHSIAFEEGKGQDVRNHSASLLDEQYGLKWVVSSAGRAVDF
jgi:hypothetical protein